MSGSAQDVVLDARLGFGAMPGRRRIAIGSDAAISVTVRDSKTRALVPGATGQSALYWLPGTVGDLSAAQPLDPQEAAPGDWRMIVPGRIPGTHTLCFAIEQPIRKAVMLVFDVGSSGEVTRTSAGTIPWDNVHAVAAAAGASAALAEARRVAGEFVGPAVAAAITEALDDIGAAAAAAAIAAVADQLGGKASIEQLDALGRRVDGKADASEVKLVTDDLGRRIGVLERAEPEPPDLTALAIAKALGIPVCDFSDGANSGLLAFI